MNLVLCFYDFPFLCFFLGFLIGSHLFLSPPFSSWFTSLNSHKNSKTQLLSTCRSPFLLLFSLIISSLQIIQNILITGFTLIDYLYVLSRSRQLPYLEFMVRLVVPLEAFLLFDDRSFFSFSWRLTIFKLKSIFDCFFPLL